jgi:hypothetical protein
MPRNPTSSRVQKGKPEPRTRPRVKQPPPIGSIEFGPGRGKGLVRIRHLHVAQHYAPLIARKSYGAVKLDLVLRAIALLPQDAGARQPGFVLRDWNYEHLHDLAKTPPELRVALERQDRQTRHLKRKWVGDQIKKLAAEKLVHIEERDGKRPNIVVLRDDGSEQPFDDPGAAGGLGDDRYLSVRGSVIASGKLAEWKAAQVAAYLAALYAEYHQERGAGRSVSSDGTKKWWRQLAWFNNASWNPTDRVLLPFSKSLLEDGFNALKREGLISRKRINRDPRTARLFETARVLYSNEFARLDAEVTRAKAKGG